MASINPTVLNNNAEPFTEKHGYIRLTITGISQTDGGTNQTTVSWKLTVEGTPWVNLCAYYATLGGVTIVPRWTGTKSSWKAGDVLASGSTTFNNASDGSLTLTAYVKQIFYYGFSEARWSNPSVYQENSVNMVCSQIPRQASLTSAPNFNDEENPIINYSNPAGNSVTSLDACISLTGSTDNIPYRAVSKTGSSYTFSLTTAERNTLRNACSSSNTLSVIFYLRTIIGGNTFYSTITKTMTIVNGNPTFSSSNISYKDNNSTTVAVTGNNQKLVQGLSSLLVTLTSATAQKGASISRYEATINGTTLQRTSAGNLDFGVINSGTNLTLSVKVVDSRGNSTTASKTVTFLAWVLPTAIISLKRKNNYEDETYLKAQATYSSVDSKNTITLKYQYKKTTDSTYSSLASLTNNVQKTLTLDKNYAYDFKVVVTDKFGTTTYNCTLAKGKFIFFVDTKKLSVGVNCFPKNNESLEVNGEQIGAINLDKIYPIGSIYMSVNSTNPGTLLGGTWQQLKDRFLLGAGSTYSGGATGGSASVTLTTSQIPSHNHSGSTGDAGWHNHGYESQKKRYVDPVMSGAGSVLAATGAQNYACYYYTDGAGTHSHSVSIGNTGGGGSHTNMPPYLVVYMWKRTA